MARSARRILAALFIALASITIAPGSADAADAPLFQFEREAKQHCPDDTVVWLNTQTGVYPFKGQQWYGNTKHGAFVCKKEAPGRATKNGQ
jgi:hypothetical protein